MTIAKTGLGGSVGILALPLMASVIDARQAIGVLLPLLAITDMIATRHYWKAWRTPSIRALLPGAVLGIALGSVVLADIPAAALRRFIGMAALLFMVIHTTGHTDWLAEHRGGGAWQVGFGAGVLTGIISTLAHVGGLITTMYLLPLNLGNRQFVATATVMFLVINILKLPPYLWLDLIQADSLRLSALLLPAVAVGSVIGFWLNRTTPPVWFQRMILFSVAVTAVNLLFF